MPPAPAARLAPLKPVLDRLAGEFERATHVDDPVRLLAPYAEPADREVAAFVAAGLAFGRVRSVITATRAVLGVLGPHPARFVRRFRPGRDAAPLRPLVHRWMRGDDLVALAMVLRHMLDRSGTIEAFFAEGLPDHAPDVSTALESFSRRACEVDVAEAYAGGSVRPGVHYFFTRPSAGSACKRLNLFLRWMVRQDAIDPGGWRTISPAQLIVPLDVHVMRVGRCLQLTRAATPGWRMAADITASLRAVNPADPVKYDFALCHLGMLGQCGFSRTQQDVACPLRGACRPVARRPPTSRAPSGRR
jgi:uncharacterized protein (TIGR02757 family)